MDIIGIYLFDQNMGMAFVKLATDHDGTVNLKKIGQAVFELEHKRGLAEMDLGLALGYVPEVLEQILFHMKLGLHNTKWTV